MSRSPSSRRKLGRPVVDGCAVVALFDVQRQRRVTLPRRVGFGGPPVVAGELVPGQPPLTRDWLQGWQPLDAVHLLQAGRARVGAQHRSSCIRAPEPLPLDLPGDVDERVPGHEVADRLNADGHDEHGHRADPPRAAQGVGEELRGRQHERRQGEDEIARSPAPVARPELVTGIEEQQREDRHRDDKGGVGAAGDQAADTEKRQHEDRREEEDALPGSEQLPPESPQDVVRPEADGDRLIAAAGDRAPTHIVVDRERDRARGEAGRRPSEADRESPHVSAAVVEVDRRGGQKNEVDVLGVDE